MNVGPNEYDVIVIGGGISGLKAALDLAKSGHKVKLLEAKDKLGGQICTELASDGKTPVELGASYWEGMPTSDFYRAYFANGSGNEAKPEVTRFSEKMESCDFLTLDEAFKIPEDRVGELLFIAMEQNLSISNQHANRQAIIDNFPFARFQITAKEQPLFKRMLGMLAAEMSSLPAEIGTLALDISPTDNLRNIEQYNSAEARTTIVKNGYSKLIDQIVLECQDAGVEIEMNAPVSQIEHQEDAVTVKKMDGDSITAKRCVCAIPVGVLKNQTSLFSPSLDSAKQAALEMVGGHDACRVVLEFDSPINTEAPYIMLDIPEEKKTYHFRNFSAINGYPMIHTDDYGKLANKLYENVDLSDQSAVAAANEKLVAHIMSDLTNAMTAQDRDIPKLKSFKVKNWAADIYAKGAYVYHKPGMTMANQVALEAANGSIHFAGSYVSRYSESVHNAYASGIRAAESVNKSLQARRKMKM